MQEVEITTRFKFDWKYWQMPHCGTPVFEYGAKALKGNHFEAMKRHCEDIFDDVMLNDLCPNTEVQGGACVIMYEKRNFPISKETPYIFTKDKRGRKIAFKLDAKGKKRRIGYAKAQTQQQQLRKGRKKRARKKKKASYHVTEMAELGAGCVRNIHGGRD